MRDKKPQHVKQTPSARTVKHRIPRADTALENSSNERSGVHCAEQVRLEQSRDRIANWQRWGTYLAERQWGTVREDYSADGECWEYFTHEHARSRAYRWGEDGLLGFCDRECRLCFAFAMWNGVDPFLKERLFGVTNHEGNHGEDVKEHVGSSRVDLQACKLEYSIVSPK